MNILALTRYDRLGASSRLRFLQYIPILRKAGIVVTVAPLLSDRYLQGLKQGFRSKREVLVAYIRRTLSAQSWRSYDLIWVEKELLPWIPSQLELALLKNDVPLILDYDDAVFHLYERHRNYFLRKLLANKHPSLVRAAALVVTGNEYLTEVLRSHGATHVVEVPTVVDLDRYKYLKRTRSFTDNSAPIVGWIGQASTAGFLEPLIPVFRNLKQDDLASFRVIGIQPGDYGFPINGIEWHEETEVDSIRGLDIGIMPLTDGPFERGKCGYKLIQYMACGLPVVASPVGVNKKIVEHGVNGFLAETQSEWLEALRVLTKDPLLRERMGQAGRLKVAQQYSMQATAPRLINLFRQIASRASF